ncbi:MAG: hypothetical protein JXN64_00815 [Spirochaetes bacterium]|nr:hypothetical protein [Spirochaetota bacterium]
MGEYFEQLPVTIKEHIQEITKTSGLEYNEESFEKMSQGWVEKKNAFEENIASLFMEELNSFSKDDERGVLIMTYSGSLLTAGPIQGDSRTIEYISIGIRSDVPKSVTGNGSFAEDIETDKEVKFNSGPIKSTSAVYKIAVCKENISVEEQQETLNNATVALEEEFTNINKTIILE